MSPEIEKTFAALPAREREAIIEYGTAMRISALSKRLALAEGKVHAFLRLEPRFGLTMPTCAPRMGRSFREHYWRKACRSCRSDVSERDGV